jgi:glycosyltransferase involved in cell wall biosynthesis
LRIVHVSSYQIPGYGYEEIQLAKAQRRMGHTVFIVASNYLHPPGIFYGVLRERFPSRQVAPREEDQDGVRVLRLPSAELGRRVWIRELTQTVARLQPDVVHSHNLLQFHPLRLALLKARTGNRFGLVVDDHMHRSVMRRTPSGRLFYWSYRRLLGPLVGRGVDRYCAISEETRDYLMRDCGVRAPIEIMPLGVDTDSFTASAERRHALRTRLGLLSDELVVLYTGKVIPAKGPRILVGAALRLLDEGRALKVLWVGDPNPEYLASIRKEIAARGHASNFAFLPSVAHDQLPEFYAGADIAVWPRQESMAVFEAMAASLPVVVSARSGYASMIEGGAGLTFREDDEAALAGRLDELRSPSLRQKLGSCGRNLVEGGYSWQRSAERYLDVYTQVLQRVKVQ